MSVCRKITNDQNGQAIILVTLTFTVLAMLVGLAVDGSRVYLTRQHLAKTVDAAAAVGAKHWRDGDHSLAIASACDAARLNNLTVAGPAGTCSPDISVSVEDFTSPDGSTQTGLLVTGSRIMSTSFMRVGTLLGCGHMCERVNVTAQAGAIALPPPCIFVTNPTAYGALTLAGSANITSPQCGIHVASNDPSGAIDLNGGTSITSQFVESAGGVVNPGNSNPRPIHVSPRKDPLRHLVEPSPTATCIAQPTGNHKHFYPDRYCSISLVGNQTATFDPGEYYIDNGFSMGGGSSASGTGVSFFIAGGELNFNGNGAVDLKAPTSGTYAGLTFVQARTNTTTAKLTGSNDLFFEGAYIRSAELWLSGGSCGNPLKGLIVADTLRLVGSTCITKPDEMPAQVRSTPILVRAN